MNEDVRQRLARWLRADGYAGNAAVDVRPLSGGQSNPTFRMRTDRGDHVLRKKPDGPLLPSVHAIDREHRVMQALAAAARRCRGGWSGATTPTWWARHSS